MFAIPVRMCVAHRVVTVLMAIAMLQPWTPEIAAQEPLDSVIPMDSITVTVLRATDGFDRQIRILQPETVGGHQVQREADLGQAADGTAARTESETG